MIRKFWNVQIIFKQVVEWQKIGSDGARESLQLPQTQLRVWNWGYVASRLAGKFSSWEPGIYDVYSTWVCLFCALADPAPTLGGGLQAAQYPLMWMSASKPFATFFKIGLFPSWQLHPPSAALCADTLLRSTVILPCGCFWVGELRPWSSQSWKLFVASKCWLRRHQSGLICITSARNLSATGRAQKSWRGIKGLNAERREK